jgi:calcineurin-like phosphoesterase family protein
MNKVLIQNWNTYVSDRDEIYILGDLIYKGTGIEANEIMKNLKGKKYLIKGNHDKFLEDNSFDINAFEWIKDYYVLNYKKIKFILFHYPIFEWEGYFGNSIHLYGHVHNSGNNYEQYKKFEILGNHAINVGVDVNNFYPISIEQILKRIEK